MSDCESNLAFMARSARLSSASNGLPILTSNGARIGDIIVQFWRSSTSAVVLSKGHGPISPHHGIVGRCSIVKEDHSLDYDLPKDKSMFMSAERWAVYLTMDSKT